MKVFISADIEGTAGISSWDEANINDKGSSVYFINQMTREVNAACLGAIEAGATEIVVKDAHYTARNLILNNLPKCVKVIRNWIGTPFDMMGGLDQSFDAVIFTGYHSGAYSSGNPLSHTYNPKIHYIKLNGRLSNEFEFNSYVASHFGVPVAFISGDKELCEFVDNNYDTVVTAPVVEGIHGATISIHPDLAVENIQKGVTNAMKEDLSDKVILLPEKFDLEISYKGQPEALKASYYPGVKKIDDYTIQYETDNVYDLMRMLYFVK